MDQHAHAIDAGHQAREARHHHHDHAVTPRGQAVPTGHASHGGHHDHSAMVGDREEEGYYDEAEVIIDPFLLNKVLVAKRIPAKELQGETPRSTVRFSPRAPADG